MVVHKVKGYGNKYFEFMSKFNVLGLAIGFIIAANLQAISKAFIDDLMMPFINPIIEKMKGEDGITFTVPGTKISLNLEKIISALIKFLLLSLIIFVLINLGTKIEKPIQWVHVKNYEALIQTLNKDMLNKSV